MSDLNKEAATALTPSPVETLEQAGPPWRQLRVLVTGARGLLGREVTDMLEEAGHHAVPMSHQEFDIGNPSHLEGLVKQAYGHLDWVVNCAAYTKVDQAESELMAAMKANAINPGALALHCAEGGVRLLHLSTDYVFDGEREFPYHEEATTNPINVYGRSKRDGEQNVLKSDRQAVIVRTSWLFGRHGPCFPKTMVRLADEGKSISVVNDQTGRPTYARDLAETLVDLIELEPQGGLYHAAGPEAMTWFEFAKIVLRHNAALKGKTEPNIVPVPTSEYPTPAKRPRHSVLDLSKVASLGLMSMRTMEEAVPEFLAQIDE